MTKIKFSDKQREFWRESGEHRWAVKYGATRSGKTYLDYYLLPKRIRACTGSGLILLIGNTRQSLERNLLEPMREIWTESLIGRINPQTGMLNMFGRRVYALGADKVSQTAKLQGVGLEYCYGDEVTTWNESVFQMLKSRLSAPNAHFDGTCNPDSPTHWFKQFLDSDADIYRQAYTIDDNPFLPPSFVENLKREYAGTVYYNRFILGQWAAAEGIIYRSFADSLAAGDGQFIWQGEIPRGSEIRIGVDFGGNGSQHAFVAVAVLPRFAGVIGLCSQRIDPRGTDTAFLSARFAEFAESVFYNFGEIHAVFCDSAEQVLKNSLRSALKNTRFNWLADRIYNSKKIPITDRIRLTSILMGGGRFWYTPAAASLRDALASALWNGKHAGRDERLDDGTTDIDTLDAFEYTIERDYKKYLRLQE